MLNEEAAASSSPPLPSPPQARQNPSSPPSRSQRSQILSSSRSRLFVLGTMAAIVCALTLFLALSRHDHTPPPQERASAVPVTAPLSAATASLPAQALPPTASPAITPPAPEPSKVEEPVQFRLKRSKAFERVGPIRLRLLRANTRWNTCELYINSGGPSYQKQAHLNKPVQINLPEGTGAAELLVTSIRADQISGSVQQK